MLYNYNIIWIKHVNMLGSTWLIHVNGYTNNEINNSFTEVWIYH